MKSEKAVDVSFLCRRDDGCCNEPNEILKACCDADDRQPLEPSKRKKVSPFDERGNWSAESTDDISAEHITELTGGKYDIRVFSEIGSTNTALKAAAAEGASEGLVYIADCQTAGRGRLGRSFSSPAGTGLYMSLLLRPRTSAASAMLITAASAVAMAETIEEVIGARLEIKWVNDLLLHGKKVCGILAEAAFSTAAEGIDHVILGLGVNVMEPKGGFPEELCNIAGALSDRAEAGVRDRIAAGFLNRFSVYYSELEARSFYTKYLSRLTILGRRISVIKPFRTENAVAVGLDRDFRLEVEYSDGRREQLSSGEVSTRLIPQ